MHTGTLFVKNIKLSSLKLALIYAIGKFQCQLQGEGTSLSLKLAHFITYYLLFCLKSSILLFFKYVFYYYYSILYDYFSIPSQSTGPCLSPPGKCSSLGYQPDSSSSQSPCRVAICETLPAINNSTPRDCCTYKRTVNFTATECHARFVLWDLQGIRLHVYSLRIAIGKTLPNINTQKYTIGENGAIWEYNTGEMVTK